MWAGAAADAVSVAVRSEAMAPRSEPTGIEASVTHVNAWSCAQAGNTAEGVRVALCGHRFALRVSCVDVTGSAASPGVKLVDVGLVVEPERATVRATTMAIERHTGGRYDAAHHASPLIAEARLTLTGHSRRRLESIEAGVDS